MDEVDRFPTSAGTEGDPVALAKKRTTTFWNRKISMTSTPTVKGTSKRGVPIVSRMSTDQRTGVRFYLVGTDTAKETVF